MTISFDPFAPGNELEQAGYSTEKFYLKSQDTHGHSHTFRVGEGIRVNVPKYMAPLILELMSQFPQLTSIESVFRDAMTHYLHMRGEQAKNMPASWWLDLQHFTAIGAMDTANNKIACYEQSLEGIEQALRIAKTPDALERAITSTQQVAFTFDDPEFVRRASEIIERYRR